MADFYNIFSGDIVSTHYYSDADKVDGLPRVSEIANLFPKKQLVKWMCRKVWEQRDCEFFDEAFSIMEGVTEEAANAGTEIHAIIDGIALGKPYTPNAALVSEAVHKNVIVNFNDLMVTFYNQGWTDLGSEIKIIDRLLGYGGRCDKILSKPDGSRAIIDWKTKEVKSGEANFYYEWLFQLCGYMMANRTKINKKDELWSVVIDRNTGDFYFKNWRPKFITWGCKVFKSWHRAFCDYNEVDTKKIIKKYKSEIKKVHAA